MEANGCGDVVRISQFVFDELWVARALLFTSEARLDKPHAPWFYCSDSSMKGYALHEAPIHFSEAVRTSRWKERWRFRQVMGIEARCATDIPAEAAGGGFELLPAVAEALGAPRRPAEDAAHPRLCEVRGHDRSFAEVTGVVPALAESLLNPARWRRVLAGAWREERKIH